MQKKNAWLGSFLFVFLISCSGVSGDQTEFVESDGTLDTEFMDNLDSGYFSGVVGSVDSLAISEDGNSLIVAGRMQKNSTSFSWARISTAGVFDESFPYTSFNDSVYSVIAQDGALWAVGDFSLFGTQATKGLFKWNVLFGSEDTAFTAMLGTGFRNSGSNPTLSEVFKDSQGNYLVAGQFTTLGASTVNGLAKINSQGQSQSSFNDYFVAGIGGGSVDAIHQLSDSRYVLGGSFTSYASNTVNRVLVVSESGVLDTAFKANMGVGFNSNVLAIAQDDSQNIWFGGLFDRWNGTQLGPLVVMSSEGTLNSEIPVGVSDFTGWTGEVRALYKQPNQKMLIGGMLTRANSLALSGGGLVRVLSDTGEIDEAFKTHMGTGFAGGSVRAIAVDAVGDIYVAGDFTSFNGRTVPGLVKFK